MGSKTGINKLLSLVKKNKLQQALKLGTRLCKSEPYNADAWSLLGSIHGQLGDYANALGASQKALTLQGNRLDALSNAAFASLSLGDAGNATHYYAKGVTVSPESPQLHNGLGCALRISGEYAQAIPALQRAISLQPAYAEPHYNLALIFKTQGLISHAIDSFRKALLYKPNAEAVMLELATCLQQAGSFDEALTLYNNLLKTNPEHRWALTGKASTYEMLGDYDQAWQTINPLKHWLDKDPAVADVYATCATRIGKQDEAKTAIEKCLSSHGINIKANQDRISSMNFKLGLLHEKSAEYDKAFECYKRANELHSNDQEADKAIKFMAHTRNFFTADLFKSVTPANTSGDSLVFIVGMPRSGTSLVEQILASHTKVHGAGESEALTESVATFLSQSEVCGFEFDNNKILQQPLLETAAKNYLQKLFKGIDKNLFVTDKMPHNFLRLGMVALLFPEAKIIHCMRDPMDTCLSIYSNGLSTAHPYASDLEQLGQHYRAYTELMNHWRATLPVQILDIHYEKLVENPEDEIKHMLNFIHLPWEDACLNHHQNERQVTTISYDQVRQPLYKSSIGRWQNFSRQLAPLKSVLD